MFGLYLLLLIYPVLSFIVREKSIQVVFNFAETDFKCRLHNNKYRVLPVNQSQKAFEVRAQKP